MKLQLALDMADLDAALRVLRAVHRYIDIIEIGTPLALREGVRAIGAVKRHHGGLPVLADFKIIDGGEEEARIAFDAGADFVTVLALAHDETVRAVVDAARRAGRQVVADLLGVADIGRRAGELLGMGVDYLCVHTASDLGHTGGNPLDGLRALRDAVPPSRLAVAGGVSPALLPEIVRENPAIVVAGRSIAAAPDPAAAAREMRAMIGSGMRT